MPTITYPTQFTYFKRSGFKRSDSGSFDDSTPSGVATWSGNSTKAGVSNPNWKVQVAKGQDATTAYTRSVLNGKAFSVSGTAYWPPGTLVLGTKHFAHSHGVIQPSANPGSAINSAEDYALRDQALGRLKRKLSSQTKSAQALVPIVELREMRGLIRTTAELSTNLVKSLLAIKQRRGRTAHKFASEAWLSWSFGIKPMIADTKAIADSIGEYLTREDFSVRLTGSASKQWISSFRQLKTTGIYGATLNWHGDLIHELSYRYTAGFDINWKSANNYGISDQLGLNIGSLPSVGWELIPYSWLVDYFTTTGAYLDDTFSSNASTTKFVVLNKRYTLQGGIGGGLDKISSQVVESTCRPGYIDYFLLTRTPYGTQLPTRQLRFKSWDEIGVNGVNRLLNLASLLVK